MIFSFFFTYSLQVFFSCANEQLNFGRWKCLLCISFPQGQSATDFHPATSPFLFNMEIEYIKQFSWYQLVYSSSRPYLRQTTISLQTVCYLLQLQWEDFFFKGAGLKKNSV